MEYSIQLNAVNNKNSSVKAFATVVFGDSFCVENISVMESTEGKLFVAMPRYKSSERTEHNEAVYKNICNPTTNEFRTELYENILELYGDMQQEEKKSVKASVQLSENKMKKLGAEDFSVRVTLMENRAENSKLLAMGSIYLEDSFVINNIKIYQGKEGKEFVAMPSVKIGNEYRDICKPITAEFRSELFGAITDAYQQKLAEVVPFPDKSKVEGQKPTEADSVVNKKKKLVR